MLVFATSINANRKNVFSLYPERYHKYDLNILEYFNDMQDSGQPSDHVEYWATIKNKFLENLESFTNNKLQLSFGPDVSIFAEPAGDEMLIAKLFLWKAGKLMHYEINEMLERHFQKCINLCTNKDLAEQHIYAIKVYMRLYLNAADSRHLKADAKEIIHKSSLNGASTDDFDGLIRIGEKDLTDLSRLNYVDLNSAASLDDLPSSQSESLPVINLTKQKSNSFPKKQEDYDEDFSKIPGAEVRQWLMRLREYNKSTTKTGEAPYLSDKEIYDFGRNWFQVDIPPRKTAKAESTITYAVLMVFIREMYLKLLRDHGITKKMLISRSKKWWPKEIEEPNELHFTNNHNRFTIDSIPSYHHFLFVKKS